MDKIGLFWALPPANSLSTMRRILGVNTNSKWCILRSIVLLMLSPWTWGFKAPYRLLFMQRSINRYEESLGADRLNKIDQSAAMCLSAEAWSNLHEDTLTNYFRNTATLTGPEGSQAEPCRSKIAELEDQIHALKRSHKHLNGISPSCQLPGPTVPPSIPPMTALTPAVIVQRL